MWYSRDTSTVQYRRRQQTKAAVSVGVGLFVGGVVLSVMTSLVWLGSLMALSGLIFMMICLLIIWKAQQTKHSATVTVTTTHPPPTVSGLLSTTERSRNETVYRSVMSVRRGSTASSTFRSTTDVRQSTTREVRRSSHTNHYGGGGGRGGDAVTVWEPLQPQHTNSGEQRQSAWGGGELISQPPDSSWANRGGTSGQGGYTQAGGFTRPGGFYGNDYNTNYSGDRPPYGNLPPPTSGGFTNPGGPGPSSFYDAPPPSYEDAVGMHEKR